MKLNNLSRLTALLMVIMLLGMSSASAATAIDLGEVTYDSLKQMDAAADMIADNKCSLCAETVTNLGLLTWPVAGYDCLHVYLASMTANEVYQMLYELDRGTAAEYGLSQAFIKAHNSHVDATDSYHLDAVICYGASCYKNPPTAPGPSHIQGTCPWYQETPYVPTTPVVTDKDISTPDALKDLTTVTLTFTATGENLTYTWQRSADPDAETPVWDDVATGRTYTLPVDAAALAYAYRCEVTDASDNVVSTSSTLYLGGKEFFAWVSSTEGEDTVVIRDWLLLEGNTVEYVLAAYAAYLKGIPLSEAIHVTTIIETVDSTTVTSTVLKELLSLSTLAEIDAEGRVIDVRYHIQVAVYSNGVLTPYTLQ